jgi:phage terminase large subunit-like protein
MSTATATVPRKSISTRWRKILRHLPFDVFRDADGFWFDEESADFIIDFIETRLRYMEGELIGELIRLEDWQKAIYGAIFGMKYPNGLRRFRNVWFYIPRKNTKTFMLALMVIIMIYLEDEGAQQLYAAAANDEQSRVLFGMVKGMIEQDDELAEKAEILANSILCDGHSLKMITPGNKGKHGKNINFAAIDEIHEHPSADMVVSIRTSKVARRQPLIIEATTADFEGESYCNERHEYAKAVRDGIAKDISFLPIIYELIDPKRWKSEKAWKEVNPNLGVSIKIEQMRELCALAERMPSFKSEFLRLHLNCKVPSFKKWLDPAEWDLCSGLREGQSPIEWRAEMLQLLQGHQCWAGLDISSVSDLTCEVLLFEGDAVGHPDSIILIPWFWCPGDNIKRKNPEFQEQYQKWVDQGFLCATPGNVVDMEAARLQVIANHKNYPVIDLAIDYGWQGADTANILSAHHGINVIAYGQGFQHYSAPMQDMEIRVKTCKVIHGANPILKWNAVNTVALRGTGENQMRPAKENKSSANKIDGIPAALMAHGRYLVRDKDHPVSRYNNPGERLFAL